jgi:hypothetical protein
MLLTPRNCKILHGYVKTLHENWNYMNRLRNELGLESRDSPDNRQISSTKPQESVTNHSFSKNHNFSAQTDPLATQTTSPMETEIPSSLPMTQPTKLSIDTPNHVPGSQVFKSSLSTPIPLSTIPLTNLHGSTCHRSIAMLAPNLTSPLTHNLEWSTYPIPSFRLDIDDSLLTRIDPPLTYLCRLADIIPSDKSVFRIKVIEILKSSAESHKFTFVVNIVCPRIIGLS